MIDKETKQLYWIYHDAKSRCLNPKHKSNERVFPDRGRKGLFLRASGKRNIH